MKRFTFTWVAAAALLCSLKLYAQPDTVWTKDLFEGEAAQIFESQDGGLLLLVNQFGSEDEIRLVKLSLAGDSLWSALIELPDTNDRLFKGEMYDNGDLLVSAMSGNLRYLIRLNQQGETIWIEELDDYFGNPFYTTVYAPDSSLISVRQIRLNDSLDFRVTKTSNAGDTLWSRAFDIIGGSRGIFWVNREDTQRVFISGVLDLADDIDMDGIVLCLDSNGDSLWFRRTEPECADLYTFSLLSDNHSLTLLEQSCDDAQSLLELTRDGEIEWQREFTPQTEEDVELFTLYLANNGGYFAYGTTGFPGESWLFRFDDTGNLLWEKCCWRPYYELQSSGEVMELSGGGYVIVETVERGGLPNPPKRVLISRLGPDPLSGVRPSGEGPYSVWLYPNYPNPFNSATEITFDLPRAMQASLKIYDVLGREVAELVNGVMDGSKHTVMFDASALPSGVYFYRLEAGTFTETRKMVLMK